MLNWNTPGQVVAQRVQQERQLRGWTQRDLAERMTARGHSMGQSAIAKLESGGSRATNVPVDDLVGFAWTFGISPVDLLVPDTGERIRVGKGAELDDRAMRSLCCGPEGQALADRIARNEAQIELLEFKQQTLNALRSMGSGPERFQEEVRRLLDLLDVPAAPRQEDAGHE